MALVKSIIIFSTIGLATACSGVSAKQPASSPPISCEFERGVWCPLSLGMNISLKQGTDSEYNVWSFSQPHWEQYPFIIREHYSCKKERASKVDVIAQGEEIIDGKTFNIITLSMTTKDTCKIDVLTGQSESVYAELSKEMSRTAIAICFENKTCGSMTLGATIE